MPAFHPVNLGSFLPRGHFLLSHLFTHLFCALTKMWLNLAFLFIFCALHIRMRTPKPDYLAWLWNGLFRACWFICDYYQVQARLKNSWQGHFLKAIIEIFAKSFTILITLKLLSTNGSVFCSIKKFIIFFYMKQWTSKFWINKEWNWLKSHTSNNLQSNLKKNI